jgi:hypothetical protein
MEKLKLAHSFMAASTTIQTTGYQNDSIVEMNDSRSRSKKSKYTTNSRLTKSSLFKSVHKARF